MPAAAAFLSVRGEHLNDRSWGLGWIHCEGELGYIQEFAKRFSPVQTAQQLE